ncbi:glycosyl hydrolase family 10 protein [Pyronema omphalodes]|nr:glycosyl hydrolase family 10 protein [Pyronema omphalodes]
MKLLSLLLTLATLATTSLVHGCLDQKMKAQKRVYIGAATDPNTFNDTLLAQNLQTEFGCVTPENSMKWESTEPTRNAFTFNNSDQLVEFAASNNKLIRGHTLVWHSQLPQWVHDITDKNVLTEVIVNHIKNVAGRYRGKIYAWDVVNEVLSEDGSLRPSVFSTLLGESFIDLAFRTAHSVDPHAKLYINDYNLDSPGPKIDAMIALIKRLQRRGVPVHGVGSQSHLILGQVDAVPAQLQRLGALGVDVAVTELDIRIPKPVTQDLLRSQQGDFYKVFKGCLMVERCVGITAWGVSDKYSWVDTYFPTFDAPLLFDDYMNRKPAYDGAYAALSGF